MAKNKQPTQEDYAKLGKAVDDVLLEQYFALRRRKQIWWDSFVKGLLGGLGGVLGATLLLGLFLWILSRFSSVPFIGHISNSVSNAVNSHR